MAYKALYRTYRPDGFKEMAGQKHIVKTLENAIERKQVAHAYLFCGPRGTGKTSTAKIFAKAINCEDENKPCGVCPNCIAAQEGTHPDIIEIDAASNNGVEEARNLIEKVKYAPLQGKYKVYIIDEVHMMSTGAFNALLKTIEEPPAHIIFILATTEPYKVIPTIISRCQRFDFAKISKIEIVKRLAYVIGKENIQVEDKVLESIAILSDGGMRDALSILDQCRAYAPDIITLQDINEIYGVISTQEVCDLLESAKHHKTVDLIAKIEQLDCSGIDIKRLTTDMIEVLKESIVADYSKDESMLNVLTIEQVQTLKENAPTAKRLMMIDFLMETYERYRQASSVISYFEIGMLKMMNLFDEAKEERKEVLIPVKEEINRKVEEVEEKAELPIEDDEILLEDEFVETIEEVIEKNSQQDEHDIVEELGSPQEESKEEIEEQIRTVSKGLDDELLLGLLVGANKPDKLKDIESIRTAISYTLEMEYAKYANLLTGCSIIASGKDYIVLKVDSLALANEINELDKNSEFLSFTNELLGKAKKVFALTSEHSDNIINLFKERSKENTLPSPVDFQLNIEKEEDVDEQMENMKSLFGDVEIKED